QRRPRAHLARRADRHGRHESGRARQRHRFGGGPPSEGVPAADRREVVIRSRLLAVSLAAALAAGGLPACAGTPPQTVYALGLAAWAGTHPKPVYAWDKAANFATMKSWAWYEDPTFKIPHGDSIIDGAFLDGHIRSAIDDALRHKGYEKVKPELATMWVSYKTG